MKPFFLPTREGVAQGAGSERQLAESVTDLNSYVKSFRTNNDGSVTMLATRGGRLEYTTTSTKESVSDHPKTELDLVTYDQNHIDLAAKNPSRRMLDKTILDFVSGVVVSGASSASFLTPHGGKITGLPSGTWMYLPRIEDVKTPDNLPSYSLAKTQVIDNRAYFYAGRMRRLAQFVLGIGEVKHRSWYGRLHTKTRAEYFAWVATQTGAVFDFASAYANKTVVQLKYNYTYNSSHGLLKGADGSLWIVEISKANGVWVWPLPIEFGSDCLNFRAKLYQEGDAEGVAVIDEFGGFPTGELPSCSADWGKTGVAKQLLTPDQMGDYVRCLGIRDHLGWAFSYDGTEARVVGTEFIDQGAVQFQQCVYMKVQFSGLELPSRPAVTANILDARSRFRSGVTDPILRTKLLWMTDSDAAALLSGAATLESLVITTGFAPTASFSTIETNPFYPVTKIWSSSLGYCESIDYPYLNPPAPVGDPITSVWFSQNGALCELREKPASSSQCGGPYTAQYKTNEVTGYAIVVDRVLSVTYTINGIASHWCHWDTVGDRWDGWGRTWWREKKTIYETITGVFSDSMAFLPYGDRESAIIGKTRTYNDRSYKTIYGVGAVQDVYFYDAWPEVDGQLPPPGYNCIVTNLKAGSGQPWSHENNTYGQGPWAQRGDLAYQDSTPNPFTNTDVIVNTTAQTEVEIVAQFGDQINTLVSESGLPSYMSGKYYAWFERSNLANGTKTMRTAANCFGNTETKQCYDDINSGHYMMFGASIAAEVEDYSPTYIGVV